MHRLLKRQIEKAKGKDRSFDAAMLLELVSAAYAEADKDRRRTDRSISLMIEELDHMNAGLEDLVARRTSELGDVSQRLEAALGNMDQGIVMIDAEGRVTVANRKFSELTGLAPADFEGGPRYVDLIQKMADAGEFLCMEPDFKDWISVLGRSPDPYSYQRSRPDGTVTQIQVTALPDGGEVRTITDITSHAQHATEIGAIKQMLETTLENVEQGIIKVDADDRIAVFNKRAEELLGFPPGFIQRGQSMRELIDHQVTSGEFTHLGDAFNAALRCSAWKLDASVYERMRPDGTILEIRTTPLPDGSAVRTYSDITGIQRRQNALERAQQEYASLFENSIVGIYRTTLDGKMLRANPALVRLNGYDSEAELISNVSDIASQWYVDARRRVEFVRLMERDGRISDFVSEVYRHKTRERVWVSEAAWLVRDESGDPAYYEGMVIDATARKSAENRIAHIALHDMLTNLPNRTLFHDTLTSALADNRRGHEIAVLCLDLDHFKDVNDTLGHDAGDVLLRLAARRLARAIPAGCMAARFGGDEFAILLPDIRDRDFVMALARTLVARLSRPYRIRGKRVYIGASIGIAIGPTDGRDAQELLKKADIALYRAKDDGRGTYACFNDGMTAAILARREIELDLRRAILQDEFCLFYQPIMDLESGRPNGYEALVRWQHPHKGLLPPAYFIDIAEESGLIVQIGELVLKQACRCIARNDSGASVSVNLSPVQFRNHQLAVSVINALAASGLPASRLILEITESVLLTDDLRTLEILKQLRMLGVRVALDDFGIGHSSLSYLQKFPFDRIKIDKSFIQDENDGLMNTAIRRAILGLGNDIGIEVVVEGVETENQRDMLIYEGCRYLQGFLYGRPKPAAELFGHEGAAAGETFPLAM